MKVVFCCLALVAAVSAEERFNARTGASPNSQGGLADKGRLSGVHPSGLATFGTADEETGRSGCPPVRIDALSTPGGQALGDRDARSHWRRTRDGARDDLLVRGA